jgi:medium-chain acyl-[acyl-carrier-protein] hydrolase
MKDIQANSYLAYRVARPGARMRLFCFPYAGGNATLFRGWQRLFPEWIEICPLQYPGRGNRLREPPFTSVGPLAQDITQAVMPLLDLPFAFFGHSMGAILAFEVTRELRKRSKRLPFHLFLSAVRAPQFRSTDPHAYDLPEPEFIEELRRLNGTPSEVLENTELMALMLPMLRADFAVSQTYAYVAGGGPLSGPVSVYSGVDDPSFSSEELEGWREHTTGAFSLHMFAGDHFYLHPSETLLTTKIFNEMIRANEAPSVSKVSH